MSQFVIDVFRPGDRVCDFRTQEFTETLAEPVHRHFHGPFGQVQMSGNLSVTSGAFVAPNGTLQFLEKPGCARGIGIVLLDGGEDLSDIAHA